MTFPKVLIIGSPFNKNTGAGITQSNFFSGWDGENLAVASVGYLLTPNTDTAICHHYYQLGEDEFHWVFPLNLLRRKYPSGLLKIKPEQIVSDAPVRPKLRYRIIMNGLFPALRLAGLYPAIKRTRLSKKFCRWVDAFHPDIIYAQADERYLYRFCMQLQEYLQKPMIFHVMDDWPSLICYKGLSGMLWNKKISREVQTLFNSATLLMSICEEMSVEYAKRYQKSFLPFHNPVDIGFWKPWQKKTYELSSAPTILYAGRTGLGISSSLELVAKAVEQLNTKLNVTVRLVLQTAEKPDWTRAYSCVTHQPFGAYENLPQVFAAADILLLPYDFSGESIRYIKFSMPTKASEYMISGTPVIVLAPEETAIVENARKYQWAKVITQNNVGAIAAALSELLQHKEERRRLAENAKALAEKNCNAVQIKSCFQKLLCSLATQK